MKCACMVWYVPVCMCLCEFLKSKIQWNQQQVVSILIPTYTNLQRTIQKICLIISGSGHIMLIHEYLEMDVYGLPLVINSVCVHTIRIFFVVYFVIYFQHYPRWRH